MIQFIKTRNVKNPERLAGENAGIDFFIPENTPEFIEALKIKNPNLEVIDEDPNSVLFVLNKTSYITKVDGVIHIAPHHDIIIPTGIKSKFDANLALIANNKSGIATKKKLIFGASVIDNSYQGEWHAHMINWSDEFQTITCGQKIIQFIPHYISIDPIEIVDCDEETFYTSVTSRGEGWAGSTGV